MQQRCTREQESIGNRNDLIENARPNKDKVIHDNKYSHEFKYRLIFLVVMDRIIRLKFWFDLIVEFVLGEEGIMRYYAFLVQSIPNLCIALG